VTLSPEWLSSLPDQTLDGALARIAARQPTREALVDGDRRWTYAELDRLVARVAGALQADGLAPGERIGSPLHRTWELPVLFLAVVRAGGIFVPVVPDPSAEVREALGRMGVRRLVRPGELPLDGPPLSPSQDPGAICYWNLTSGSTGLPKAAPTTHAQVHWNTRACLESSRWRPDERYLCLFAPFAHPHEHWARPLTTGGTCVMGPASRPKAVLALLRRHRVSWLFAVPSTVRQLAREADQPLPDLRVVETGGALVEPALVHLAEERLGAQVMPIWGCTEATGVVLHVPPWDPDRDLESLGRPLAHYDVRVLAPDAVSAVGELVLAGPAVVSGYESDADPDRFVDGRYWTGDLVRAAPRGHFHFAGRRQDVIKVAGLKVYLGEVERLMRRHPGIADVAVVPARDEVRSEVPRAVVVAGDPALTPERVARWCREHLRPEQRPRRIELRSELPRGPTGKLDRRRL